MTEVRKRSVMIAGHPTSVTLEAPFWDALKELAAAEGLSVNALIERVDATRTGNLSSALRVHILAAFRPPGSKPV
ncbi:aryl-sulfate sulfotransferase [Niveispirillum lacus]|uniref:Aryl-sulfate sulfotransferase n=1 Tax=Niveispirillum lacus TaxID=1981099 RepID=A0A255YUK2_9PROT|nr:ribbon-helix-helix domain-containing protein [Niveispirillum lacus]OYQ32916.1 aryl-sulfate sulfotransferase [Niveispirillum lacus]